MTSNGEVGLIDKYCVGKNRQAGVAEVPGIFLANGAGAMAIYTVCLSWACWWGKRIIWACAC